jgi:hypothetical protein
MSLPTKVELSWVGLGWAVTILLVQIKTLMFKGKGLDRRRTLNSHSTSPLHIKISIPASYVAWKYLNSLWGLG